MVRQSFLGPLGFCHRPGLNLTGAYMVSMSGKRPGTVDAEQSSNALVFGIL